MMPAPLELDFIATSRQVSLVGVLVLMLGTAAAAWTVTDYRELSIQSVLLEMELDSAAPRTGRSGRSVEVDLRAVEDAKDAVRELSRPWSQLLNDLEVAGEASRQNVALLSIEPDLEKRRVRIGAEARTLPAALAFLQQLQEAGTLEYPLLDNHKVREDVRERPVYFELTADWSLPL
jgi:hypothetical protein